MTTMTWSDLAKIVQENQESVLANTYVEFPLDVNKLSALDMLRYAQCNQTVDDNEALARQLLKNKSFIFQQRIKNEEGAVINTVSVLAVSCVKEGPIYPLFEDKPWLLDMLYDVCRSIVLKNLTPRSVDYRTPEMPQEKEDKAQPQQTTCAQTAEA